MGGGLVGPGFAPFTPPSSPETKPADSPKLPTQQLQRSTSCPGLGRPIADRFVLDLNITDINAKAEPELEPQLPPTPKSEINTREVMINSDSDNDSDSVVANASKTCNPCSIM